jgi:pantetheine-phosphate adenylyltransferase
MQGASHVPDGRTVICPGSYDPVTYGHLDIIERAAKVFAKVVVGIVNQPLRKQATLFTAEERLEFLLQATEKLGNVEAEVFDTLLVDFAHRHGATALVKGLRAISDFEYEFEMNQLNRKLAPEIETVYLMASPEYSFIRSSGIKEMATFGARVEDLDLVPAPVATALRERVSRVQG